MYFGTENRHVCKFINASGALVSCTKKFTRPESNPKLGFITVGLFGSPVTRTATCTINEFQLEHRSHQGVCYILTWKLGKYNLESCCSLIRAASWSYTANRLLTLCMYDGLLLPRSLSRADDACGASLKAQRSLIYCTICRPHIGLCLQRLPQF